MICDFYKTGCISIKVLRNRKSYLQSHLSTGMLYSTLHVYSLIRSDWFKQHTTIQYTEYVYFSYFKGTVSREKGDNLYPGGIDG